MPEQPRTNAENPEPTATGGPPPPSPSPAADSSDKTVVTHQDTIPFQTPAPRRARSPLDERDKTELLNTKLGPYRITDFLGKGGMALVYRAEDADGAPVALKVMQETPFLPADRIERFRRESDAAKKLRRHPHIVTIYDTGQEGPDHYIAMELVPGGRTLHDLLGSGPVALDQVLHIALAIAKALEYAHENGIIHRDIKPGNILLNEFGEALLGDFGLARIELEETHHLTMSAVAIGTPRYMSPEQTLSTRDVTAATDIYSFGLVIYELLTGTLPYEITPETGLAAVFDTIRHTPARNPRKIKREIPRNVCAILLKLLEKDPRHRYPDMTCVVHDLEACLEGRQVSVHVPNLFERLDRFIGRHKYTAAAVLCAASIIFSLWKWYEKQLARERGLALLPKAEEASRAGELEELKRQLSGEDQTVSLGEELLQEATDSFRRGDDLALVREKLTRLLAHATETGHADERAEVARLARWELARVDMAGGSFQEAADAFSRLLGDSELTNIRRQMVMLEHALALQMDGQTDQADIAWRELLSETNGDTAIAKIAKGALGDISPAVLAAGADEDIAIVRILRFWVASLRAESAPERRTWQQHACDGALNVLPWVHYRAAFDATGGMQSTAPEEGAPGNDQVPTQ